MGRMTSHILWKIKIMFQTTNQKCYNTSQKEFFFILLSGTLTSNTSFSEMWNQLLHPRSRYTSHLIGIQPSRMHCSPTKLEDILTNRLWEGLESKVVTGILARSRAGAKKHMFFTVFLGYKAPNMWTRLEK